MHMQISPMHKTDSLVLFNMRHAPMPHRRSHHRLLLTSPRTQQPLPYIAFVSLCVSFVFFCVILCVLLCNFCVLLCFFCVLLCFLVFVCAVLWCDVMYVPSVLVTRVCLIKLLSLRFSFLQRVSGVRTPPITPSHTLRICACMATCVYLIKLVSLGHPATLLTLLAPPLAFISSNLCCWGTQPVL